MENMYQFDIFGKTLRLQTTDGNEDDLIRVVKYFMDNVKQVYDANPNRAFRYFSSLPKKTVHR